MSKIVIFEGLDNCGKTTNINKLYNYWAECNISSHKIHYSGMKISSNIKAQEVSMKMYEEMFRLFENFYNCNISLIVDRSHLGENVYSHYRNYSPSYIWPLEEKYYTSSFWNNLYLIYLKDNNLENVLKREDGKSFSTKIEDKIFERDKFDEAVYRSKIKHKKIIDINNKSKEDVFNEVLNGIQEQNNFQKYKLCIEDLKNSNENNYLEVLKKYF